MTQIKIRKATPLTVAVLITMVSNYRRDFDEYIKTSKNDGLVSDDLIRLTLEEIEADLEIHSTACSTREKVGS